MSALDDLYTALDETSVSNLYHFTAIANFPSIREHKGLFPRSAHSTLGIECTYCSDEWSRSQDQQKGLDHYIHLSLDQTHAMVETAHSRLTTQDNIALGIITISRSVLEIDGAMFCGDISNITYLQSYPVSESGDRIRRLTPGKLRRAEILIPDHVAFEYFVSSRGWNGKQTSIHRQAKR